MTNRQFPSLSELLLPNDVAPVAPRKRLDSPEQDRTVRLSQKIRHLLQEDSHSLEKHLRDSASCNQKLLRDINRTKKTGSNEKSEAGEQLIESIPRGYQIKRLGNSQQT